MGLEPAVHIANLVCGFYEYEFLLQLVADPDAIEWQILSQFKYVKRYIDDVLAIACPCFHLLVYKEEAFISPETGNPIRGIYPHGTTIEDGAVNPHKVKLTINLEHSLGVYPNLVPVTFLDLKVSWCGVLGEFVFSTYDKRSDPKFNNCPLTRFPPPCSLMWPASKEGIVTSEFSRAYATNSDLPRFLFQASRVVYELSRKFDWGLIVVKGKRFLTIKHPLYKAHCDPQRRPNPEQQWQSIESGVRYWYRNGLPELDLRNRRLGFNTPYLSPNQPTPQPPPPTPHAIYSH